MTASWACGRAGALLHARLDGELGGTDADWLGAHLATCSACREIGEELALVREALRAAPLLGFPERDLEEVWDRTIRAPRRSGRLRPLLGGLAAAGLAAVLLLSGGFRRPPDLASDAEVLRAAADLRLVLRITDRELRRTGATALHEVIGQEIAPALRQAQAAGEREE